MVVDETPAVLPLEEAEKAARLPGFTAGDFAIFNIPGFADRMPAIRACLKPKLVALGDALTERLSETVGETLYPHVAQHMRRSVNPAEETWVAFARSKRAYKPFVHVRAAISAERARVVVFIEDDAEDKLRFAANLERNAEALSHYFARRPAILAYDLRDPDGRPLHGHALSAEIVSAFALRLGRVKAQHAVFGIEFANTHPVVADGPQFADAVVAAAVSLRPVYDCGAVDNFELAEAHAPIV